MDTPNKYQLINVGKGSLFPECQADFYKPNLYEFETFYDVQPGDYIRITDNHYFMGMAKVVRRVFSDQYPSATLYCERVDPRCDYVFTKQYEVDLIKVVIKKVKAGKFKEGVEPDNDVVHNIIETLTNGKTSVDYWNVRNRTDEILSDLLHFDYHRPSRLEFEDF